MEVWQCCRTCCGILDLNRIFRSAEHHEKYSLVLLETTGVKIDFNDSLPQLICTTCLNFINESYKFRKQCQQAQSSLTKHPKEDIKYELDCELKENQNSIDITDLLEGFQDASLEGNQNFHEYENGNTLNDNDEFEKSDHEMKDTKPKVKRKAIISKEKGVRTRKTDKNNGGRKEKEKIECEYCHKILTSKLSLQNHYKKHTGFDVVCEVMINQGNQNFHEYENDNTLNDNNDEFEKSDHAMKDSKPKVKRKPVKSKEKGVRTRKTDKNNGGGNEKEEIECEYCHKILTSKLSLRNHYKIHTGFDVVCEHCGKKFITRRLLLMHCKAKHGYEKTDKCSYCDYRASNAEQVKIHERLHTGEKPYSCGSCDAAFHRKSSYLQHVAIHLPDKTVQCPQCPGRFKSATLMRIHMSRHRATRYTYRCALCDRDFARRRNVARHLCRVHAVSPRPDHIQRKTV